MKCVKYFSKGEQKMVICTFLPHHKNENSSECHLYFDNEKGENGSSIFDDQSCWVLETKSTLLSHDWLVFIFRQNIKYPRLVLNLLYTQRWQNSDLLSSFSLSQVLRWELHANKTYFIPGDISSYFNTFLF